jgi:hypothetical protein
MGINPPLQALRSRGQQDQIISEKVQGDQHLMKKTTISFLDVVVEERL